MDAQVGETRQGVARHEQEGCHQQRQPGVGHRRIPQPGVFNGAVLLAGVGFGHHQEIRGERHGFPDKERARRLIASGQMTPAGMAILPDLDPGAFTVADDILAVLQADPQTWANFQGFPDLYKRVRIGYIEEVRKQPAVFQQRLANFLKKTSANKMFGTLA